MWQATVVHYVSMFRHPDFQWRHHLRGTVAAVTSQLPKIPIAPPPHHVVVTSCCAMLLLYVGGRIVLRLIRNNVSNALPKLLSKDEPNFKISLNYLDIDNFHDFKLKMCTGYTDDVFTNDVCRNKTANTNT